MGHFTDNLFKKGRTGTSTGRFASYEPRMRQPPRTSERLTEVAIMLADGSVKHGFRSHGELRRSLKWDNPYETRPGTRDGFWTNEGRFLTRAEAKELGNRSGQAPRMDRELLSSDVDWQHG